MQPIDYILILILLYGAYEGYKKGFIIVLFTLLALILGIIGGFKLLQVGIDLLMEVFPHTPKLLPLLSFILIFALIVIGVYMLGVAIKKAIDFTVFVGIIDNIAGAIVSLFQWAFMLSIPVWLIKQSHMLLPEKYIKNAPVFNFLASLPQKTAGFFTFILPFAADLFKQIREIF